MSVKKNFIYNIIYQILIIILPFITVPYVSRTLGVSGVGIYSYTYSIIYYFMLICLLGINNYGNRVIAKNRDNIDDLSKNFWSVYCIQLIMSIIMLICYLSYVFFFDIQYKEIAIIQCLFLLSSMFDINWFFFGIEDFKVTITRNTVLKLITLILIFVFIKGTNDLWIYTLIMSASTLLSQLLLWPFLLKKTKKVKISLNDIITHIKPCIILFVPVIAVSLYKMMDKIMLGSLSNILEVGYFENAEKILNVPLAIVTALGTVMLPRISNIVSKGKETKVNAYIEKSSIFISFIIFATMFGLIAISNDFSILFFGDAFKKSGILMAILALTLPFVAFANIIRTQYLIPKEKDKIYLKSVSLGAIINLVVNLILIKKYGSIGACIGTIAAEITVMLYQTISVSRELNITDIIKKSFPFFIKSVIMFVCIYPFNYIDMNMMSRIIIQIVLGSFIYFVLNVKYIFNTLNLNKFIPDKMKAFIK